MRYAVLDTVLRNCFNESFDPEDEDNDGILEELEDLEEGIAELIDKKCRRTFGMSPKVETRTVSDYRNSGMSYGISNLWLMPLGDPIAYMRASSRSDFAAPYILPWGVRNVTSVAYGGEWDGEEWEDEETLPDEDWILMYRKESREPKWAHGIFMVINPAEVIRVTGEWEDGAETEDVPPEIREAASYIVADAYRTRSLSPAGEIGPNGLASYVRNVWEEPFIKDAIKHNTFRQLVI